MSLSRRSVCSLAALALASACTDFTVPPPPAPPEPPGFSTLSVQPSSAFAGERVKLVADPPIALGGLEFQIGGQRVVADRETGEVEVPFFENACRRELLVEAADPELLLKPATLAWLGPGHPGRTRPRLAREVPVRFSPTNLHPVQGGVIASSFGSVIATIGGDQTVREASHVGDFVESFEVLPIKTTPRVFYMGRHGGFGVIEANDRSSGGLHDPVIELPRVPAVQTALPSAIYSGPTSFVMNPRENGAVGVALGQLGNIAPQRVLFQARQGELSRLEVEPHPRAEEIRLRAPRLTNAGAGFYALAVAGTPAIEVHHSLEESKTLSVPLGTGTAVPVSLSAATGRDPANAALDSTFVATVWRGDLNRSSRGSGTKKDFDPEPITFDRGGLVLLASSIDGAPVTRLISTEPFDHVALTWIPAPTGTLSALEIVAANEESPLLWRFRVETAQLEITYQEVLPLTTPVRALTSTLDNQDSVGFVRVVARDAAGSMNVFSLPNADQPARQTGGGPVRVGLSGADPRATESCGDQSVVLASSALGSTGVVAVEGSAEPAWFPGVRNAAATAAVEIARDPGQTNLLFFASLSEGRLLVTESVVQARAKNRPVRLDADQARFTLAPDANLLVAVPVSAERAHLVTGGAGGLATVGIGSSFDPHDPPAARRIAGCTGVTQLVAAGSRAVALSKGEQGTRLCLLDPESGELVTGPALPEAWDVKAIASMLPADPDAPAGRRVELLLAGTASDRLLLAKLGLDRVAEELPVAFDLGPVDARLPLGTAAPASLAVSPDGRRALLGLAGAAPGVLIVDPLLLGDPEATAQQKLETVATLATSAAPIAFSIPNDGMRAIAVLENDRLAIIE